MYFGVNYTASVSGATVVCVTCENCGDKYYYQLARVGHGRVHCPFDIGGGTEAQRRARERAKQSLRRKLDEDVEAIPCPECGWYQKAMTAMVCRSRLRWLP